MNRFKALSSFISGLITKNFRSGKNTMPSPSEQKLNLANIQPMLVPSSYVSNGWDLPHL